MTDIESTLKQVVTAVLSEPGVPERDVNARAKALKKLGSIFQVQTLPPSARFRALQKLLRLIVSV